MIKAYEERNVKMHLRAYVHVRELMESFREMLSSYMCALDLATSFFFGLATFFDLPSTIRSTVDAMQLTLK